MNGSNDSIAKDLDEKERKRCYTIWCMVCCFFMCSTCCNDDDKNKKETKKEKEKDIEMIEMSRA